MKPSCNLFIVTGPLVWVAAECLLESDLYIKKQVNFCFVFSKSRHEGVLPNCQEHFFDTKGLKNYMAAIWRFKSEIKKIESNFSQINVYLANPAHFATNYAFFEMKVNKRCMLPEGVANYYNAKVSNKTLRVMWAKSLLGFLIGLPFNPYRGHISAWDLVGYDVVYTFNEKGLITKGLDIRKISLSKSELACPANNIVVFLDQDIGTLCSKATLREVRSRLKMYIKSAHFDVVYYKSHPSQKKSSIENFKDLGVPVKIIASGGAIEKVVHKIGPVEVISFISSALVTISDTYPEIKCTSVGFLSILNDGLHDDLYQLFLRKNIQMI